MVERYIGLESYSIFKKNANRFAMYQICFIVENYLQALAHVTVCVSLCYSAIHNVNRQNGPHR